VQCRGQCRWHTVSVAVPQSPAQRLSHAVELRCTSPLSWVESYVTTSCQQIRVTTSQPSFHSKYSLWPTHTSYLASKLAIASKRRSGKKPMLRERTDGAWFSCLLQHPARKRSGFILTTPAGACTGYFTSNVMSALQIPVQQHKTCVTAILSGQPG